MGKIYLYLARRDKKGVKILTVLNGKPCSPGRLIDVKKLGLPAILEQQISQRIYQDRMLWEPWIESADKFLELRKSLKNRGFSSLPLSSNPKFIHVKESIVKTKKKREQEQLIVKHNMGKTKTMLRKKS